MKAVAVCSLLVLPCPIHLFAGVVLVVPRLDQQVLEFRAAVVVLDHLLGLMALLLETATQQVARCCAEDPRAVLDFAV